MQFGLCSLSGAFPDTIDVFHYSAKRQLAFVCHDDIRIFNKTLEEDNKHFCKVLSHLNIAGAPLALNEWRSLVIIINYLGQFISFERLELASHTTIRIQRLYFTSIFVGVNIISRVLCRLSAIKKQPRTSRVSTKLELEKESACIFPFHQQ